MTHSLIHTHSSRFASTRFEADLISPRTIAILKLQCVAKHGAIWHESNLRAVSMSFSVIHRHHSMIPIQFTCHFTYPRCWGGASHQCWRHHEGVSLFLLLFFLLFLIHFSTGARIGDANELNERGEEDEIRRRRRRRSRKDGIQRRGTDTSGRSSWTLRTLLQSSYNID